MRAALAVKGKYLIENINVKTYAAERCRKTSGDVVFIRALCQHFNKRVRDPFAESNFFI